MASHLAVDVGTKLAESADRFGQAIMRGGVGRLLRPGEALLWRSPEP